MSTDRSANSRGGGGKRLLLGNEAIAQGLYEAGCSVAAAYPGTPSTEVLESLSTYDAPHLHLEWSVNEKIALEVAAAASYAGLRSTAVMKQVGLNVALDPLMSLAYTGVVGGMLIVVADDPGPHSSQTEQDTRLLAMASGVPILDPVTPEHAREMVHLGYEISERFNIPVILRPVLRICHSRAPVPSPSDRMSTPDAEFIKDVNRWAATPRHRYTLHKELNEKLERIAADSSVGATYNFLGGQGNQKRFAVLASGVAASYAVDILEERELSEKVPILSIGCQWPLNIEKIEKLMGGFKKILVLEETSPFMEILLRHRLDFIGRLDGTVPSEGEITPEIASGALERLVNEGGVHDTSVEVTADIKKLKPEEKAGEPASPPILCAGCPHRSSFWALKKAMPEAIYTGDIGCYTLGIALEAVDTVLCMGASISQAAGFYWAYRKSGKTKQPIAAVIGDSTFFHAGVPALINAVQQGAAFVLMILDNDTTAMTGCQPTPGSGILAGGGEGRKVHLEEVVKGCGVNNLWITDPCDYDDLLRTVKEAALTAAAGNMAVVISRSPCVLNISERQGPVPEIDYDMCTTCGICTDIFGCPAILSDESGVRIVEELCPGCGVCVHICPTDAISATSGATSSATSGPTTKEES